MSVASDTRSTGGDRPLTPARPSKGSVLEEWMSSTDHKVIGYLYLVTSFGFLLIGGAMALLLRIQLLGPDQGE